MSGVRRENKPASSDHRAAAAAACTAPPLTRACVCVCKCACFCCVCVPMRVYARAEYCVRSLARAACLPACGRGNGPLAPSPRRRPCRSSAHAGRTASSYSCAATCACTCCTSCACVHVAWLALPLWGATEQGVCARCDARCVLHVPDAPPRRDSRYAYPVCALAPSGP